MRILYASERPPYPFFLGGAARCAHQLLVSMASELDVECMAVGSSDYAVTGWGFPAATEFESLGIKTSHSDKGSIDCGYPIQVLPDFTRALSDFIDNYKPDIIWAQLEGAKEVLALAKQKGIQGLYYVHDAEFDPAELCAIADLGCHMICSSGFLASKASKVIGRPCHVVYPASELYFGIEGECDGPITMINPFDVKGVDTFFEIAKRMPDEKFLLLESWKLNDKALAKLEAQLSTLPNVDFQRRVSDMQSIYSQTRLLIAPSVWEEGFGMVAIEAQSCRIPVIASARGGLPESVGDGGILIDDYRNADTWVEAIRSVLSNETNYQKWSELAYQHARSDDFLPLELSRRFLAVCLAPPKQDTGHFGFLRALPFIRHLFHRSR